MFIAHGLKGISDCQQRIGGKRNDGLHKIQRERERERVGEKDALWCRIQNI